MTNSDSAGINPAPDELRDEWLERLTSLLGTVEEWAKELGWSILAIKKRLDDAEIGRYTAPAMLLQRDTVRVVMEPIARVAPGARGVVDLYLLPGYDDIASLYFVAGKWQVHYMFSNEPTVGDIRRTPARPLSKQTLADILEAMTQNAV
ncbi:MAG: hypothetical protein WDZ48_02860 [Pirellulales bacterium]